MPKISLPDSYKFRRVFSIVVLDDVNDGGTPYMGISPGRKHPYTHQPEREQPINTLHPAALHGTRSGRTSLKKCVFGCEGKITLFSFPKEPSVTWTVDIVCFSGAAMEFLKCFVDERFIKQGPIRRWICTWFNTERWSGPSYKRSRSWFRAADGKRNGIKCLCFVGYRSKCWSLYSSAHTTRLHSLAPPTQHASTL